MDLDETVSPLITVGYDFSQPENVSAILLVTGKEYLSTFFTNDNNNQNLDNYQSSSHFTLDIFVNGSKVWGAYEYMVSVENSSVHRYKNSALGLGLAQEQGSSAQSNDELVYLYYVFPQKLNVNSIQIRDKTGTEILNVSELMVFENSPIKHLTTAFNDHLSSLGSRASTSLVNTGLSENPLFYNGDFSQTIQGMGFLSYEDPERDFIQTSDSIISIDLNLSSTHITDSLFKQIVLWEPTGQNQLQSEVMVLTDSAIDLTTSLFLNGNGTDNQTADLFNNERFTTPFGNISGNPLPYVPLGIDSPKSFNYKMVKQNEAREWYLTRYPESDDPAVNFLNSVKRQRFPEAEGGVINHLLATDSDGQVRYSDSYLTEIDLLREFDHNLIINSSNNFRYRGGLPNLGADDIAQNYMPFLPGFFPDGKSDIVTDYRTIYSADKVAGVDSLGMLMGVLSMVNVDGHFPDLLNNNSDSSLNTLYQNNLFNFHLRSNDQSVLSQPVRLKRGDLEKISLLVPDLDDIQPGDLIVSYSPGDEPHIGIVISVSITGTEKSVEKKMEKVLVISVHRAFRQVNLGLWKGPNNTFGGFAPLGKEKSYHVRRLLKLPSGTQLSAYTDVSWDLLDRSLVGLDVELHLQNDPADNNLRNRWIPNTGEALHLGRIEIQGVFSYGDTESLDEEHRNIKILPPVDPYADEEPEGIPLNSNVYTNTGSGLEFFAVSGNNRYLLAIWELQPDGTYITRFNNLDSDYPHENIDSDIFDENGNPLGGYQLRVRNNFLELTITDANGNISTYPRFEVRPFGDIDPGDDFLLSFGLLDSEQITGAAKEIDLIGVYDKKMLWRANLYIEEANDWNDAHPWDDEDPWVHENRWNRTYDGSERLSENNNEPNENDYLPADPSNALKGNGGQVVNIKKFTYHPAIDGDIETSAVAYSYGCNDSPFEFNDELRQQELLAQMYNRDGVPFLQPKSQWGDASNAETAADMTLEQYTAFVAEYIGEASSYPEGAISLQSWAEAYPTGTWTDQETEYLKPSNIWNGVSDTANYTSVNLPNNFNVSNYNDNFPFLPGWALHYYFTVDADNNGRGDIPPDWVNAISAGVDYNGFVARSASWNGNNYVWADVNQQNVKNRWRWFTTPSYPNEKNSETAYAITDYSLVSEDGASVVGLKYIKPGDIMHYNTHIVLVRAVDRSNGEVLMEHIKFIESTWAGDRSWAEVYNQYLLSDYQQRGVNWRVMRLKEND